MGLFKRKPAGEEAIVNVKSQVFDASNAEGLREEIMGALKEHGIDPTSGQMINATDVPGLQSEILGALGEHGIDMEKIAAAQQAAFSAFTGAAEPDDDPVAQLAKLAELHKKGVLSDYEFATAKEKILNQNWDQ